jgi:hypothetical protein
MLSYRMKYIAIAIGGILSAVFLVFYEPDYAYLRLSHAEKCEKSCSPNLGAIEKVANRPGGGWRGEPSTNYSCVCRDPKSRLIVKN